MSDQENSSGESSAVRRERAERMLESITDAFLAVDRSWRFTYVNQTAADLMQLPEEKLLGRDLWSLFPEADAAEIKEACSRALETGETARFEVFYPPRARWYRVHAYPYGEGLSIYFSDVTDRKKVEQTLRESDVRTQAILDTTVDGIITIDEYGLIEAFNQAAESIFGYKAVEVIGENVKILMPEPYRREHDDYLENYRKSGQRKIIGIGREVTGRRKDGSTFPMDLAVSEVKVGDRRIFTGIVRDISKQRQLEQEILEISEQERRRIGQDLHDGLGQMLTGIRLISRSVARQLDERGVDEAGEVAEIADFVQEADQYARTLSRGLVPVDLDAEGLTAALRELTVRLERLFRIECTFEEEGKVLVHDNTTATHLYRIAQEAVSNAAKHGRADQVAVRLTQEGGNIFLIVDDNGIGMPEVPVDETGMGIRIMKYRARLLGGTLEIHSGLEDGTKLICSIPNNSRFNLE